MSLEVLKSLFLYICFGIEILQSDFVGLKFIPMLGIQTRQRMGMLICRYIINELSLQSNDSVGESNHFTLHSISESLHFLSNKYYPEYGLV